MQTNCFLIQQFILQSFTLQAFHLLLKSSSVCVCGFDWRRGLPYVMLTLFTCRTDLGSWQMLNVVSSNERVYKTYIFAIFFTEDSYPGYY